MIPIRSIADLQELNWYKGNTMELSDEVYNVNTEYSKWENYGMRRVYLSHPILDQYNIKAYYFESPFSGYVVPYIRGYLENDLWFFVKEKFGDYLIEKGIIDVPDAKGKDWWMYFDKFSDFWRAL